MANLIPAQTRHEIARSIYRDIITGKDFYHVFAGKSFSEAETPVDTRHYLADIHKNMLLAKRVVPGPNDVVYMIRRKDWESGTIYVEYDDFEILAYEEDGNFIVADFYVLTDEYKIFKCLQVGRNLLGEATASTVKPTSTNPEPTILSDGYMWKFMYEVPTLDRIKFLTTDYIPVRNISDGVNFDVNGVIESVRIENPGQGYIDPYLVIEGDGVVPTSITFNGDTAVDNVEHTIDFIGHTFETGDAVRYNAGGGTPISLLNNNNVYYVIFLNTRTIRLAETLVDAEAGNYIEITSGILKNVAIEGNGGEFTCDASSLSVGDRIIITGILEGTGTIVGYSSGNVYKVSTITGTSPNVIGFTLTDESDVSVVTTVGTTTGLTYKIEPTEAISHSLTPIGTTADVTTGLDGGILSINVTNSLRGYTHARPVMYDAKTTPADGAESFDGRITASANSRKIIGDGTRFTEQLEVGWTITDCPNNIIGVVAEIISDTELVLQTFPNFEVSDCSYSAFSGGGFEGTVVLGAETASLINQNVVLNSVHGAIYKVDILDGGAGYDTATVRVIGDGSGAEVYIDPNEDIENGVIKRVQIINSGQNYNYARLEVSGFPTESAELRAHVGPPRGHGFNIAQELFAHSLCISTTVTTETADLFEGNDFRQLGIVKNLKLYNDTQDVDIGYFRADTGTAAFVITVPEAQYLEYNNDDEIVSSFGGLYRVLTKIFDARTEEYKVYLLYKEGVETMNTNTTFTNITSEFENLVCTNVEVPKFDKNTGTIMYVNEFSPITRTAEQIETIKLFLHF